MPKCGLLWSDKIDLEGNRGWFGSGEINALFEVDFESNEYRYLNNFSDYKIDSIRNYSICKKYKNKLFCFPIYGEKIWVYDLLKHSFSQIFIGKTDCVDKLLFSDVYLYDCRLYAVSRGLRSVLEIDPEKESIKNIIKLPEAVSILSGNCIQNNNLIYCTSYSNNVLCQINMDSKEIELFEIPSLKKGICTISLAENDEFWFSGFDKAIYVWNKKMNQTTVINNFPDEFGIYISDENDKLVLDCNSKENKEAFFAKSINMEKHLWFIPFRTNKVLYVDKNTYEIHIFEIQDEQEYVDGWHRYLSHKYLVEYVREDRFIGLYSTKNRTLLEIDTEELVVKERSITLEKDSINKLAQLYIGSGKQFREDIPSQKYIFMELDKEVSIVQEKICNIGEKIYQQMI